MWSVCANKCLSICSLIPCVKSRNRKIPVPYYETGSVIHHDCKKLFKAEQKINKERKAVGRLLPYRSTVKCLRLV